MTEAPQPAVDFGRTATDYDRYRLGFPDSFYERLTALGWIAPGMRVLDVGTGTGALALGLAARGLHVVGLDPSPELLDMARRRARGLGVDVPFVEGTAEATGMEPASFDLVSAAHCWWWLDGPRAVAEARRVLKPGGRLLMANFSYLPTPGSVPEATERLVLAHNPAWTKAGESGIHEEQIRDLDAASLLDVQSFSYVEPASFTHEAWRGRMRACSGVGAALPPADVEAFDRDLAAMLAKRFPEELMVPHRVFVATGRMP